MGREPRRGPRLGTHGLRGLGAVLGLPSLGVTHRPLLAHGDSPGPEPGATAPLRLDGEVVVGAEGRTAQPRRDPLATRPGD